MQVDVDRYYDKFPKFEEDDGYFTIGAAGKQTGNRTDAGLPYYRAVWSSHFHCDAAAERYDARGKASDHRRGWLVGRSAGRQIA